MLARSCLDWSAHVKHLHTVCFSSQFNRQIGGQEPEKLEKISKAKIDEKNEESA